MCSPKSIELATLILILLERSLSVLPKESHYDTPKYWQTWLLVTVHSVALCG